MKKEPRVSTFYGEYDRGRHALWMLWQYDKKAWENWSRIWRYGAVPCVCHGYGRPQDELGLLGKHSR